MPVPVRAREPRRARCAREPVRVPHAAVREDDEGRPVAADVVEHSTRADRLRLAARRELEPVPIEAYPRLAARLLRAGVRRLRDRAQEVPVRRRLDRHVEAGDVAGRRLHAGKRRRSCSRGGDEEHEARTPGRCAFTGTQSSGHLCAGAGGSMARSSWTETARSPRKSNVAQDLRQRADRPRVKVVQEDDRAGTEAALDVPDDRADSARFARRRGRRRSRTPPRARAAARRRRSRGECSAYGVRKSFGFQPTCESTSNCVRISSSQTSQCGRRVRCACDHVWLPTPPSRASAWAACGQYAAGCRRRRRSRARRCAGGSAAAASCTGSGRRRT